MPCRPITKKIYLLVVNYRKFCLIKNRLFSVGNGLIFAVDIMCWYKWANTSSLPKALHILFFVPHWWILQPWFLSCSFTESFIHLPLIKFIHSFQFVMKIHLLLGQSPGYKSEFLRNILNLFPWLQFQTYIHILFIYKFFVYYCFCCFGVRFCVFFGLPFPPFLYIYVCVCVFVFVCGFI